MCRSLLHLLLHVPKMPNMRNLLHWVNLGHFDVPKFPDFFWNHCTRRELFYIDQVLVRDLA